MMSSASTVDAQHQFGASHNDFAAMVQGDVAGDNGAEGGGQGQVHPGGRVSQDAFLGQQQCYGAGPGGPGGGVPVGPNPAPAPAVSTNNFGGNIFNGTGTGGVSFSAEAQGQGPGFGTQACEGFGSSVTSPPSPTSCFICGGIQMPNAATLYRHLLSHSHADLAMAVISLTEQQQQLQSSSNNITNGSSNAGSGDSGGGVDGGGQIMFSGGVERDANHNELFQDESSAQEHQSQDIQDFFSSYTPSSTPRGTLQGGGLPFLDQDDGPDRLLQQPLGADQSQFRGLWGESPDKMWSPPSQPLPSLPPPPPPPPLPPQSQSGPLPPPAEAQTFTSTSSSAAAPENQTQSTDPEASARAIISEASLPPICFDTPQQPWQDQQTQPSQSLQEQAFPEPEAMGEHPASVATSTPTPQSTTGTEISSDPPHPPPPPPPPPPPQTQLTTTRVYKKHKAGMKRPEQTQRRDEEHRHPLPASKADTCNEEFWTSLVQTMINTPESRPPTSRRPPRREEVPVSEVYLSPRPPPSAITTTAAAPDNATFVRSRSGQVIRIKPSGTVVKFRSSFCQTPISVHPDHDIMVTARPREVLMADFNAVISVSSEDNSSEGAAAGVAPHNNASSPHPPTPEVVELDMEEEEGEPASVVRDRVDVSKEGFIDLPLDAGEKAVGEGSGVVDLF